MYVEGQELLSHTVWKSVIGSYTEGWYNIFYMTKTEFSLYSESPCDSHLIVLRVGGV